MTSSDQPAQELAERAAPDPPRAASRTRSAAESQEAAGGGDPACWACLVCQECGAVVSEGHRAGCPQVSRAAGPSPAGS
jgi:hypothetical protein